jgi:hypothetical protein
MWSRTHARGYDMWHRTKSSGQWHSCWSAVGRCPRTAPAQSRGAARRSSSTGHCRRGPYRVRSLLRHELDVVVSVDRRDFCCVMRHWRDWDPVGPEPPRAGDAEVRLRHVPSLVQGACLPHGGSGGQNRWPRARPAPWRLLGVQR